MLCGHIAVVACDVADVGKAVARIFFSEEVGLPLSFPFFPFPLPLFLSLFSSPFFFFPWK